MAYDYVFSRQEEGSCSHFSLLTNYPRKLLECDEDGGPQLDELDLHNNCILYVQDQSD